MSRRSYAKTCMQSCRGERGAAHAKFYLFSQDRQGRERRDVRLGQPDGRGCRQPVERHVHLGRQPRTSTSSRPGSTRRCGRTRRCRSSSCSSRAARTCWASPRCSAPAAAPPTRSRTCSAGSPAPEPTKTKHGRTIIRAAPDVMRNERGMAIAQRLRELWAQGCDVRIAYTVMGIDVFRFLGQATARGPCAQEAPGPGLRRRRRVRQLLPPQGADDQRRVRRQPGRPTSPSTAPRTGRATRPSPTRTSASSTVVSPTMKYQHFIDFWYENFPRSAAAATRRSPGPSPTGRSTRYANDRPGLTAEEDVPVIATPAAVRRVDGDGIALWGFGDRAIDVLFDGRRVWSFWLERDTRTAVPGVPGPSAGRAP